MAEIAPANLKWMGTRISPDLGGVLSGIIGDRAHTSGYHRGWKYVSTSDYSRQLAEDKNSNGDWACGIDMSFSADKMKLYTGRLKAAADRNDPRLKYVREFYGTLNGTTVYGRTHRGSADTTWESATSDKSHLWHLHLSILRQYADNKAVLQGILNVLMGKSLTEDDMDATQDARLKRVEASVGKLEDLMMNWRGGMRFMNDEETSIEPVLWRIRDEAEQVTAKEERAAIRDTVNVVAAQVNELKGVVAAFKPAEPTVIDDEQLKRVLREVLGGLDGATPTA